MIQQTQKAAGSAVARWGAVAIFALASTWNYLDRQVLAAAAPQIRAEFRLSNADYGWLISAFSLAYALASPAVGWFLDWIGLEAGISWAVGFWSAMAAFCGWSRGFAQLVAARVGLGVGESAGVPAAGKLNAIYLEPENRAIGAAVTQVGLTIGGIGAPLLVTLFVDWRSPFVVCAALGLAWIPLWLWLRRRIAPYEVVPPRREAGQLRLLTDWRLLTLAAANMLWMIGYSFGSNWATLFLVQSFRMTAREANGYAWFPPLASTLGAFTGGWISRAAIRRGSSHVRGRVFAAFISAIGCLVAVLAPISPTPFWATMALAASYFWTTAGSVNLYTIPIDIWGGGRAGTAISALVCAYGLMQAGISPLIGHLVDQYGYQPVCWLVALPPLVAWLLLRRLAAEPGVAR
ncbi:MAG TPA: MFS transporter [Bryobacteraceae bacterium]|nr:MFS transporter [Bryobacteraceae bacterium]